jgi:3-methyl-2-oxobutanoate hydroxymethyltransferase
MTQPTRPKRVVTITGRQEWRNFTVRDLIDLKGQKQLVQIMAFNPEEAAAAEEAGIDLINVRWDVVNPGAMAALRQAAPKTFMTYCLPPTLVANDSEALRAAFTAMEAGADGIYCAWSLSFIETMAQAGIPVQGHTGLVPRKSTWTGGLKAVGKSLSQAQALYDTVKSLESAGAWSVECEVIPDRILRALTHSTTLVTVSLGSGPHGDVQYLFAEDILGESEDPAPRHSRQYRAFHKMRKDMQRDRVSAFREFAADSRTGRFPSPKNTVGVDEAVLAAFENFLAQKSQ